MEDLSHACFAELPTYTRSQRKCEEDRRTEANSKLFILTTFEGCLDEFLKAAESAKSVVVFPSACLGLDINLNGLRDKLKAFREVVSFLKDLTTVIIFALKTAKLIITIVHFFLSF